MSVHPSKRCKLHGYLYVSMPRVPDEDGRKARADEAYEWKCPLNTCDQGIYRVRQDIAFEGHAGEMTRVKE